MDTGTRVGPIPGPWEYKDGTVYAKSEHGPWEVSLTHDDTDEATGRLIAAAPELLEALEAYLLYHDAPQELHDAAEAAIARARG